MKKTGIRKRKRLLPRTARTTRTKDLKTVARGEGRGARKSKRQFNLHVFASPKGEAIQKVNNHEKQKLWIATVRKTECRVSRQPANIVSCVDRLVASPRGQETGSDPRRKKRGSQRQKTKAFTTNGARTTRTKDLKTVARGEGRGARKGERQFNYGCLRNV